MKNMDPDFSREGFERELREYIVLEVVDACLSTDREALKAWCGEAVSFSSHESIRGADKRSNRYIVLLSVYVSRGLVSFSKVLDIQRVDVSPEHANYHHYLTDPLHR